MSKQEYSDPVTLPSGKRIAVMALLIAVGILIGSLLHPENDWQSYLRWVLASAGTLALSSVAPNFYSYPETVDEYRRYRPTLALQIGTIIGVTSGITVFVLRDDAVFAIVSSLLLAVWLLVVIMAGTWITRQVTRRGIAARDNRLTQRGDPTRSSYKARISHASRRARPGTKDWNDASTGL